MKQNGTDRRLPRSIETWDLHEICVQRPPEMVKGRGQSTWCVLRNRREDNGVSACTCSASGFKNPPLFQPNPVCFLQSQPDAQSGTRHPESALPTGMC